jgi:hypothetical protein
MKKVWISGVVGAAGLLMLSACATTSNDEMAANAPDEGVTEEGTQYTCRMIRVTGTRMTERVCTSNEQWEDQARRTQDGVDHIGAHDRGAVRPAEFGGPGR